MYWSVVWFIGVFYVIRIKFIILFLFVILEFGELFNKINLIKMFLVLLFLELLLIDFCLVLISIY